MMFRKWLKTPAINKKNEEVLTKISTQIAVSIFNTLELRGAGNHTLPTLGTEVMLL